MTQGKHKHIGFAALLACVLGSQAFAQAPKDCVKLDIVAQTEMEVVDAKGVKTKVLEPAAKVVPGTEVVYSLRASNVCQPLSNVMNSVTPSRRLNSRNPHVNSSLNWTIRLAPPKV